MHRKLTIWGVAATLVATLGLGGCDESGTGGNPFGDDARALLFVSRAFIRDDGSEAVSSGNGQTIDYGRYVPGGHLYVLEPPTPDGELRDLTEGFEGVDINGIDLSFDATQVVFSMRTSESRWYHIYVANLDGSEVRQLTFGDADDVTPIWVPGDRIAFVTNEGYTAMGRRADEYNHSRRVTQIATVGASSGDADRRLCSQNLSNTAGGIALDHDGTIVYSRWEHLGPRNDVKVFRMNPDCTNMVAVAGEFNKPFNSLVQCHPEEEAGVYTCIGTSRRGTIQAGSMYRVDARSQTSTDPALYWDVQQARFEELTPLVPAGEATPPTGVGRYRSPRAFGDRYLVSWADGPVNELAELANTAPDFGIFLFDPETQQRTLIYNDPNMWDLYAIPVAPRSEIPPVIPPTVDANPDPNEPAVIGSIDITQTSLNERVNGAQFDGESLGDALGQAVAVRIIEGFSSEIGPVGEFGLTMHEGAAILGETPVYADGSWRAQIPAFLPYHLQPIDQYGLAIRNQMLWIQAMPGETRNCGGCHASRSDTVLPREGTTTIAQQRGADESTFLTIPDRLELPWFGSTTTENVQDILDRNCVQCHDGGANDPFAGLTYTIEVETMGMAEGEEPIVYQIPYLLLTDEIIQAEFEGDPVEYPASYISLLYPSAMMGDVTISEGELPPEWIVPGSARRSRAIEVVNITGSNDGSVAWADRPLHPEDQGVTVSREDRLNLIRMADNGGQYYSRRNVEGDWADRSEQY